MNARRLLPALAAALLLAAPHAALADNGYYDNNHAYRPHWNGNRYAWNHDAHRYWSRRYHRWIYDPHYYWDSAYYHWVPDHRGNFILVRLSI